MVQIGDLQALQHRPSSRQMLNLRHISCWVTDRKHTNDITSLKVEHSPLTSWWVNIPIYFLFVFSSSMAALSTSICHCYLALPCECHRKRRDASLRFVQAYRYLIFYLKLGTHHTVWSSFFCYDDCSSHSLETASICGQRWVTMHSGCTFFESLTLQMSNFQLSLTTSQRSLDCSRPCMIFANKIGTIFENVMPSFDL